MTLIKNYKGVCVSVQKSVALILIDCNLVPLAHISFWMLARGTELHPSSNTTAKMHEIRFSTIQIVVSVLVLILFTTLDMSVEGTTHCQDPSDKTWHDLGSS